MKHAKCNATGCGFDIKESTSHKCRKEALAHWNETGHRTFRKVIGWGNWTLPVHPDHGAVDPGPMTKDYEEATFEDIEEETTYLTREDLTAALKDYVPRNTFRMKLKEMTSTFARDVVIAKQPEHKECASKGSVAAVEKSVAGLRDCFENLRKKVADHIEHHPDNVKLKDIEVLVDNHGRALEDLLGAVKVTRTYPCIRCGEESTDYAMREVHQWRKGTRDKPPGFRTIKDEERPLCKDCDAHIPLILRINKGDKKHLANIIRGLWTSGYDNLFAYHAPGAEADGQAFDEAMNMTGAVSIGAPGVPK